MKPALPVALLIAALSVFSARAETSPARPIAQADLRSGYHFQGAETRALQDDEFANPVSFAIDDGRSLWTAAPGGARNSCADCHGEAGRSMRGVAARYPAWDGQAGRVVDLESRIILCRTGRQQAEPFAYESKALIGMTAFVTAQSRGLPISVDASGPALRHLEAGRALHQARVGQMNVGCTHCHDQRWGRQLRADTISQGHGSGYPAYRIEWQAVGSLQRRIRSCFFGVRAEQPAFGSQEIVDLTFYLAWRARGLVLEGAAVRR